MKWKALGAAAFLMLAVSASVSTLAQPYPYGGQRPYGGPYKKGPPSQPIPTRQGDQQQAAPHPGRPPFERLSPEERGQLRRDIERHGREIYPDPRRERRR